MWQKCDQCDSRLVVADAACLDPRSHPSSVDSPGIEVRGAASGRALRLDTRQRRPTPSAPNKTSYFLGGTPQRMSSSQPLRERRRGARLAPFTRSAHARARTCSTATWVPRSGKLGDRGAARAAGAPIALPPPAPAPANAGSVGPNCADTADGKASEEPPDPADAGCIRSAGLLNLHHNPVEFCTFFD